MEVKKMSWSASHDDFYAYSSDLSCWVRVGCNLKGMDCTSLNQLPPGTRFDGAKTVKGRTADQYAARLDERETAVGYYEHSRGRGTGTNPA